MSTTSSGEYLLEAIAAAFPREPILARDAFSEWGTSYLDAADYRAQLEGKVWHELDRDYLVRRADALGFLGTRVLVAVLPIYLRAVVEDGARTDAAGMLTVILRKPGAIAGPDLGTERFEALVGAMTEAQRSVVARVLEAFVESYADSSPGARARATLESYWRAWLPVGPVTGNGGGSREEGSDEA